MFLYLKNSMQTNQNNIWHEILIHKPLNQQKGNLMKWIAMSTKLAGLNIDSKAILGSYGLHLRLAIRCDYYMHATIYLCGLTGVWSS